MLGNLLKLPWTQPTYYKVAGTILLIFLFATAVIAVWIYRLWRKREERTRESFSFAALAGITALTGMLLTSVTSQSTPWHLIIGSFNMMFGRIEEPKEANWVDYAFLFLVYLVAVRTIR